jgi:GIY-YIG catalytic domain
MNYLYKITNLLNNKIYIGVHTTVDLNDGYMGSGKIIKSAIKKYGVENFTKEILESFDTYLAALEREAEIVTDDFLLREDVYNLRRGGSGGFDYINKDKEKHAISSAKGRSKTGQSSWATIKSDPAKIKVHKERSSANLKYQHSIGVVKSFKDNKELQSTATMLAQTVDAKEKRINTLAAIKHQQGTNNSQYGSCWITKDSENKKVKKEDLSLFLDLGWTKGRCFAIV